MSALDLSSDTAGRLRAAVGLARVMRPGGTVYAAELILREPRSHPTEVSEAEWFG